MRRVLGLALIVVVLGAAPAGAAKKPSEALKGCRVLAAVYDPHYANDDDVQLSFAGNALRRLRKVKDSELHQILTHMYEAGSSVRLGAWCTSQFPKDRTVREANYPTS